MAVAIGQQTWRSAELFNHRHRDPEIHGKRKLRTGEGRRRDADNLITSVTQADRLANDVRIRTKTPLPQTLTNDDDRMCANCVVFFRGKRSAHDRFDSHHVKVRTTHYLTPDHVALRFRIE